MTTSATPSLIETMMESKAMQQALATAMPAIWDEEQSYKGAAQAKEIGKVLVQQIHKHLVNSQVGYLFREKMSRNEKTKLAHASKAGGKLAFYSKLDFVIEINWEAWKALEPRQKVALIDHELCHFGHETTENGERYVILDHDLEEFTAIVQRWGTWSWDVQRMHRVMVKQIEIFEQPTAK